MRTLEGRSEELGLREVFRRAPELSTITGDLPTQTVAIYRLLLAILRRAVVDEEESPVEEWERLWQAGVLPAEQINAYLDRYTDRFDLLNPDTPFYQVAGLRTDSGKTSGLKALIGDVPNGFQYFTTRSGTALERISYAEAARWLLHCHAFDPSGIKSGAVGDERVKGGKGYPIGTGWVGGLGHVLAEGRTVFETLILNLVLAGSGRAPFPTGDLPLWERPAQDAGVEQNRPGGEPVGPIEVLTWQSRRIRLIHDGAGVTDALISNGDPLSQQNRHHVELATGWRRSEPQEKQLKQAVVNMPAAHGPGRSFWRNLSAILPQVGQSSADRDAAARKPPEVLNWLAALRSDGVLDAGFPLRLHAVGVAYGSNNSVIDEIIDDVILLDADILSDSLLRTLATTAVEDADKAVAALVNLAGNLVAAAGGAADGARLLAREEAFFALDAPYRVWVRELNADTPRQEYRAVWQQSVRKIITASARRHVEDAGTPAWVGREVRDTLVDTGIAIGWFDKALKKALPLAFEPATTSSS